MFLHSEFLSEYQMEFAVMEFLVSYLNSELGYSAGVFQALWLAVFVLFYAVDYPFAPCMSVHIIANLNQIIWLVICAGKFLDGVLVTNTRSHTYKGRTGKL